MVHMVCLANELRVDVRDVVLFTGKVLGLAAVSSQVSRMAICELVQRSGITRE
jgi:hypothetical protein